MTSEIIRLTQTAIICGTVLAVFFLTGTQLTISIGRPSAAPAPVAPTQPAKPPAS